MVPSCARTRRRISIHTPLAGSDLLPKIVKLVTVISIHTPLAGSDTLLASIGLRFHNFNPHSPCGERLKLLDGQWIKD